MQTLVTLAVSAALASGHFPDQRDFQTPATVIPVDFHSGLEEAVQEAISDAMEASGGSTGRGNGNGNGNTGVGNGNNNSGNNNGNNNSGNFNGNGNSGSRNGNNNSGNNNGNASDGNGNGSATAPSRPKPKSDKSAAGQAKTKGATGRDANTEAPKASRKPCRRRTFLGMAVNNCNN